MIFTKPFIEISTASFCTVNCEFCPQKLYRKAYAKSAQENTHFMSLDTYKKIESWTPKNFQIRFSGFVEPFMNPKAVEMILYSKKQNRQIGLFTTLMNVSLKDLKKIIQHLNLKNKNEDSISIHLPSNDKIEHFTINHSYLSKLEFILSIENMNIDFHYHGQDMQADVKKIILASSSKAFFVKLISRSGNVDEQSTHSLKNHQEPIRCSRLEMHEHVILPDGRVALCCNDFGLKHILGNIHANNYKTIHLGKEMQKILAGQNNSLQDILCRKCEFAIPKKIMDETSKNKGSITEKRQLFETWKILQGKARNKTSN